MLKQLRPLFPYMKKYRRGYVCGGLTVLLNNGIWILGPLAIRGAVNDLQGWHDGKLPRQRHAAQAADLGAGCWWPSSPSRACSSS